MAKRQTPIAWHYPRTSLAQTYLKTLDAGLISSLVLFAPRRKGKTEFLLEDLLPAAESSGYRTVYCSMWQNRTDPLAALLASLSQASKPRADDGPEQATQRKLSLSAAHNAFVLLGRTPGLFHDAIECLMKSGGTEIDDVARHVLAESHQASGYAQRLAACGHSTVLS